MESSHMKQSIKTLLKTSVALGAIVFGSTSWAATWIGEDGINYEPTDRNVSIFAAFTAGGTAGVLAPSGAITATKDGAIIVLGTQNGGGNDVTPTGELTATKNSKWYLGTGVDDLDLSGATLIGPASDTATLVLASPSLVTLPAVDATQFVLSVLGSAANIAGLGGDLYLPTYIDSAAQLTIPATITAISGALTGAGVIELNAATININSDLSKFTGRVELGASGATVVFGTDLSKFTGTLVTGDAVNFSSATRNPNFKLPQNLELGAGADVTFGSGKLKKFIVPNAADGGGIVADDFTIEEVDLTGLTGTVDFSPTVGKKITVKKLTGATDSSLIIDNKGAGELVLPKLSGFSGSVTTSATGTVSYK